VILGIEQEDAGHEGIEELGALDMERLHLEFSGQAEFASAQTGTELLVLGRQ
jgi:hypothetical protein